MPAILKSTSEMKFGLKYYNNTVLGYQLGFYDQVSGNITISLKIKSIITLLRSLHNFTAKIYLHYHLDNPHDSSRLGVETCLHSPEGLNQLPEFNTISNCLFTMFRISIVDSYNYDAMYGRDALMTFILVGSFIALEAILAVNLLIAMLNCAFNRDNTVLQEKLYMARASILLYVEKYPYFSTKSDELYHYIKFIADPIVEPFYIEENTLEEEHNIKVAVFEIKRDLEELIQKIEKDEHNIFLQQLLKMYGEKEVMGNMSTRFSEERVSMILKNIINLQKAVTILHQQQDETYNRLKNSIEDLCERFEKELKYKPKKGI
ncbi:hypothetical protein chiPu_0008151 [Chiloscyllium punctatum]|uniref:Ion transport domain-containing protein n=1 Tax=Chiloscyllium punctatum TaxID=137246 RepID=A0A401SH12_CHIPU|nr:hypothetical protein [Chiloscyllium punctatum]